jgi:mediator of RNA polymerase II transcription subunit 12, fungi type
LAQEILVNTEGILKTLVQVGAFLHPGLLPLISPKRFCLSIPDVFIGPRLWATYSPMIEVIMHENLLDASHPEEDPGGIRETLLSNLSDIRKRNEALSFRNSPTKVSAKLSAAVSHAKVKLL